MAVNTTNYKFNKPVVGADSDSWGGELNENWDKIDSLLYGASYTDGDSQTVERIQPDLLQGSWAVNGTAITATATQLNNIPAAITGAASTILSSNLSAGKVLISDENGKIAASSGVSSTELNKLDGLTASTAQLNHVTGVTSAIQTQINGKLSTGGGTLTGSLNVGSGNQLHTDAVNEVTSGSGVTIDSVLLKDDTVTADSHFISGGTGVYWEIVKSGTTLQFKNGSTVLMTLDSSGNLSVAGNVNSNATL